MQYIVFFILPPPHAVGPMVCAYGRYSVLVSASRVASTWRVHDACIIACFEPQLHNFNFVYVG